MIDIIVAILCTIGAIFILIASIGILRMPDFYLRLSVTVKAATLGNGFMLACCAIVFPQVSVTTKALAVVFFLILTAPVAAHLIARSAYLIGTPQWKGTVLDEIEGMYDEDTHVLHSDRPEQDESKEGEDGEDGTDGKANPDSPTKSGQLS